LLLRYLGHDQHVLDDLFNREVRERSRCTGRHGRDFDRGRAGARALRDPKIPAQQVMLYRDFVRCVFTK
jgi:hypothetical protein